MTLHSKISYFKSTLRILACIILLCVGNVVIAFGALFLLLAEILGIVEEAIPGAYKGTETTVNNVTTMTYREEPLPRSVPKRRRGN